MPQDPQEKPAPTPCKIEARNPGLRPGISLDCTSALLDDLEVEEFLARDARLRSD